MTKATALGIFKEEVAAYPHFDRIELFEAWCIYTDGLHREGRITDRQVSTWSNPYSK